MICKLTILLLLHLSCISRTNQQEIPEAFYNASTDFAADFLKELSKEEGENIVFSPSNIQVLLAVLQQGAQDKTAEQLELVLHASNQVSQEGFTVLLNSVSQTKEGGVTLRIGTNLYLKPKFSISESFQKIIVEQFHFGIQSLDTAKPDASNIINKWVANITDNHITSIVKPGTLSSDSVMVLVSAIFFNGKWLEPFTESRQEGNFTVATGQSISVPFITAARRMRAGRDDNIKFKWVQLPYQGEKYSMVLILPTKGNELNQLVPKLTGEVLRKVFRSTSTRFVRLRIPKFVLSKTTPVKDVLYKMGLTEVFSVRANLSGIGPLLYVSDIVHEALLQVDEQGSQASAASAVFINTLSLTWNPDEMNFNARVPFLVFIIDKVRGLPLFAAKIVNPS